MLSFDLYSYTYFEMFSFYFNKSEIETTKFCKIVNLGIRNNLLVEFYFSFVENIVNCLKTIFLFYFKEITGRCILHARCIPLSL